MKKHTKTQLNDKELNSISGGWNMPSGFNFGMHSPLVNINMNIGILVIAGSKLQNTNINFSQINFG